MSLKIYNVLTRQKEEFVPLVEGQVGMYVCGPTVYDHAHLGHAKTYVAFDIVARYLRFKGHQVRYVQNITDVGHILSTGEDRILKGARREQVQPMELVETYTRSYFEDMDSLGVVRPNISPRASAHVPEQIEMVKALLEKGHAYEVDGNVYFDVSSFDGYGKLSGRKVEDLETGTRVDVREDKRHPADFALWKKAEPEHILRWPSPWGWGYPGWHVECSAMSTKYLGDTFDIHGGGLDNLFPHNECEIAQAEASLGQPFARYWMLTGSLTVGGVKMSKSLGNFLSLKDALKLYSPYALRFFILSSHYRSPVDFSRDALLSAQRGVERLHNAVRKVRHRLATIGPAGTADLSYMTDLHSYRDQFVAAMDDDFNTAGALAVLFDMNRDINRQLGAGDPVSRGTLAGIDRLYRELGGKVLGIIPDELGTEREATGLEPSLIQILLDLRDEYRREHDYKRADAIRDRLTLLGIVIEDQADGSTWRLSSENAE
ncbi:MAG: cysteine--tRNA ligase [Anaerolineae bacterium]|jgi:cysteinyl-tRNA synthetase